MRGLLAAISILTVTVITFAVVYKRETGRNLFKDLLKHLSGHIPS